MINRLLVALLFCAIASSPAAARKVALVIGNGAYTNTTALPNPVQDARGMAGKLEALGFEVTSGYDEDLIAMQQTVSKFARGAIGADLAVFFYAGHGLQVHGDNFLVPIDAKFEDETALDFETMPVDFIMRQMSRDIRVRVIILDACRNNPLARSLARAMAPSRSAAVAEGLAEIKIEDPGEGTVIAFATSPGDVAYDGDTMHSPFTAALLNHIDTPDTPIQNVMTRVTRDVYLATKERQRPWVNASLIGEVYLNQTAAGEKASAIEAVEAVPPASVPAAVAPEERTSNDASIAWEREKILFESAQKSGVAEDYRAYLEAYPEGQFAGIANNFITRAQTNAATEPAQIIAALPPADTATTAPVAAAPTEAVPPDAGPEISEAALDWDRAKRREVQLRLELTGEELGRVDGNFGARTRAAISTWQAANGFDGSGFLTSEQFEKLVSQTDEAYERRMQEIRKATEKPPRATARTRESTPRKARSNRTTAPRQGQGEARRRSTTTTDQVRPQAERERRPSQGGQDPCLTHPGHRVYNGICLY